MLRVLGPLTVLHSKANRDHSSLHLLASCDPTESMINSEAVSHCPRSMPLRSSTAIFPARRDIVVSNWEYGVVTTSGDLHDPVVLSHCLLCLSVFWYCPIVVLTLVVPAGIK